jgi:FkbM family methyltransferase
LIAKLKNILSLLRYINNHPLGSKHRLLAYIKFLNWQVTQLLNPKEKKVTFTDRTSLLVKKGMTGATGNIYLGLHEFNDMGFLLHFLRPQDIFFDIGANVGSYTILASGHCKAFTFCFEPIFTTFSALYKNILLNNIEHLVKAKNIGLGDAEGVLLFTKTMDTVNHVMSNSDNAVNIETIEVQVLTADSMLTEVDCPVLIKIDVEGFETSVLNGMDNILKNEKLKGIIIELNGSGLRYGFDEMEIHKKLVSLNFCAYNYNPFTREIKMQEVHGDFNTIYLRDILFVKERLAKADNINIFSESF